MLSWIPNALTISRCIFAALVLYGALNAWSVGNLLAEPELSAEEFERHAILQQLWHQFAFLGFISGMLTDYLDGWTARKLNATSRFGVWLDPIADKLLVAAALFALALAFQSWLIYIPAALIIARDAFMTWLRTRPEAQGIVAPSALAKVKTGVEMLAIAALMLPLAIWPQTQAPDDAGNIGALIVTALAVTLLWAAAALSLLTGYHYVKAIRRPAQ